LAFRSQRAAAAAAENVLLQIAPLDARGILEKRVRIEGVVAEELIRIKMNFVRSGFQNRVDVSAAVPSLRGVVKARLYLELLDHIRAGKRRGRQFGDVVVRRGNS